MSFNESTRRHISKEQHYMAKEDTVIVISYVVLMIFVALWALQRTKSKPVDVVVEEEKLPWALIGLSLFSNNVGGDHFIGLPGAGATMGITISNYEFSAAYVLLLLGWLFIPVYMASQVRTCPEYMYKRLGSNRLRVMLSISGSLIRLFSKALTNLYGGGLYMRYTISTGRYTAEAIVLIGAASLTVAGGLDPIIWTDLIQTGLMIIGAAILMVVSFHQIGTEKVVFAQYSQSEPNRTAYHIEEECNKIDPKAASLFRSHNNSFLPWPGVIFGLPVITVWYWCVDEVSTWVYIKFLLLRKPSKAGN